MEGGGAQLSLQASWAPNLAIASVAPTCSTGPWDRRSQALETGTGWKEQPEPRVRGLRRDEGVVSL